MINDNLKTGYQLKELFLDIVNHSAYEDVKTDLKCWIDLCRESEIGEFIEVSNTIENWLDYIANSFIDKRLSNGFKEELNNKIKSGLGYKKFEYFIYLKKTIFKKRKKWHNKIFALKCHFYPLNISKLFKIAYH